MRSDTETCRSSSDTETCKSSPDTETCKGKKTQDKAAKRNGQKGKPSMETCEASLTPDAADPGGLELSEVWPEGAKARNSSEKWFEEEGVPGPTGDQVGHRPRQNALQPGFGLVNKPVAANSTEWRSPAGQAAIEDERLKHEKRMTWEIDKVVELADLLRETRGSGEEVVIGGVHPVMYEKHSEDKEHAELRARVVFTAPRARTSSGLDPHTLYNEISSAPVTFQGARTCRAVGALKGFITSTRDAETAYLQAELKRKNSARTFVALPKSVWPKGWSDEYKQPVVPLRLALFGHPEAGNLWQNHSFSRVRILG